MNRRDGWIPLVALVLALAFAAGTASAGEKDEPAENEMAAMIEAALKMAAPDEHHAFLASMEGKWRTEGKFWMAPGTEPMVALGEAENRMILGGRFLRTDFTSEVMGRPFQGIGFDGYDKPNGKFVSIWMDDMTTSISMLEGSADDALRVRTLVGDYTDGMTGETSKMKTVTKILDEDRHVFIGYNQLPNGEFFKSMEITYTRM